MPQSMIPPPEPLGPQRQPRRIGVEIEFSGFDELTAAELVRRRFGGRVLEADSHRYIVEGTRFGDFTIELDSQYAHPEGSPERREPGAVAPADETITTALERNLRDVIGDIVSLWLPIEIVAPPIPMAELPELDPIVQDLRAAGAEGTNDGLLYAFGTQLNVEAASLAPADIVRHLQAFIVLREQIRAEINLDVARRMSPFVDPFPDAYARRVLDRGYNPSEAQLIDDYIDFNPTRNRELDMMPMFAELDPDRVRARIDDPLIKPRPAFHYRLPDTRLSDPDWSVITEWNRWVRVEQLAADPGGLRAAADGYLSRLTSSPPA
jgi:hypothetical protein